jgi:hypothetical protein
MMICGIDPGLTGGLQGDAPRFFVSKQKQPGRSASTQL